MFIEGFGIAGYRSFGSTLQKVGPCGKINLLIGQNNSGKSNILYFLHSHYEKAFMSSARGEKVDLVLQQNDRHLGDVSNRIQFAFGLSLREEELQPMFQSLVPDGNAVIRHNLDRILKSKTLTQGTNLAWFIRETSWAAKISFHGASFAKELLESLKDENALSKNDWYAVWSVLTSQTHGTLDQHWIPETLNRLIQVLRTPPKIILIPAIRRIGESGTSAGEDYSGSGLIDRLAQLQNPGFGQQELKVQFEEINLFLRTVTGNTTATLEIPYARDTILVHFDGRTLPLSNLGTGIHEVMILAAAATVIRSRIICIEEIEIHLHPLLQKKLIRYLQEKTDNQYFITTHSAHLLDTPGAAIFHITHENGHSVIEPVVTADDRFTVCTDLGYRASDLLQANCVIWVEGPSDRIYLNYWIHSVNPDLIEGLHYAIMFYGGRLLSHLSALDPEIDEFISLRRLNRNISIVIDSDRSKSDAEINETKKRVSEEFNSGPGFAWITQGRMIENYISPDILTESIKNVHSHIDRLASTGQYDQCLHYLTPEGELKDKPDKVKIANEVTRYPANLDVLDLRSMVTRLVDFIAKSNDFVEPSQTSGQ